MCRVCSVLEQQAFATDAEQGRVLDSAVTTDCCCCRELHGAQQNGRAGVLRTEQATNNPNQPQQPNDESQTRVGASTPHTQVQCVSVCVTVKTSRLPSKGALQCMRLRQSWQPNNNNNSCCCNNNNRAAAAAATTSTTATTGVVPQLRVRVSAVRRSPPPAAPQCPGSSRQHTWRVCQSIRCQGPQTALSQ